ncbi:glycosyltransferase family 4 protein [Ascidiimonas sp. W6]|uniref:glycosyltransferase family 4 protein n=1 Tax=Ascidiimonas meishanensis TaxID=3128903 RepID=UPI0030EB2225
MKIDFVINSLVGGGAERVMVLLANYFSSKGHDISIITFNEPDDFELDPQVKRVKLHQGNIKNHTIRSILNLTKYYTKRKNRPQVMIPFMTHGNFIGILVSKLYGIKTVSSEHNNHLKKTDQIGAFTKKYLYRFTNVLTVLTAYDVPFYKKHKATVEVMPNPCTFKALDLRNPEREKVIIAVGDLNRYHHKGFDNLIPLIAPVLEKYPKWKLKMIGAGNEGLTMLQGLTAKHGISDQVIFTGFSDKVADIMKVSEIFILPSRFEGLPMVLLEAMSQGLACLAYDCITGPSDIIEDKISGLLVENQNPDKMAELLQKLIDNDSLRQELGSNAIKSLGRFRIEVIYQKYMHIFTNLLKINQ